MDAVIVQNSFRSELNGTYHLQNLHGRDSNTLSFLKDEDYQLYRYQGQWRIGKIGVKVYQTLEECFGQNWNISELDLSYYKKIDIEILEPIVTHQDDSTTITYSYLYDDHRHSFTNTYLSRIDNLYLGIEGVIGLFIPHCILTGKTIHSKFPVDQKFLTNIKNTVPVFQRWHDKPELVLNLDFPNIKKSSKKENNEQAKFISTCTLGVDSFYTLFSNMDQIRTILFVIGFDIKKDQTELLNTTIDNLKRIAKLYNKELILCQTDLQHMKHGLGFDWGKYFHGPALFNTVYGLSNNIDQLLIPSTHCAKDNYIWGSSFHLDPYYSSSFFNIHHDGDLSRTDKIEYILKYDFQCLDFLRVCWINEDQKYNCSNCEKCLRTLYPIELLGFKDKATTFNQSVLGTKYWSYKAKNDSELSFQVEIRKLEYKLGKSHYQEVNMKDFFKKYKDLDQEIIYIPNPGNAGDALIAYGTIQIFNEVGLSWTIGNFEEEYTNKILFYAGGGNLVGWYKDCRRFFLRNKDKNQIVLLPHSIRVEDELIKSFGENIIIICREWVSYDYVYLCMKYRKNLYLADDMALYIKISELEPYLGIAGKGEANCFRLDGEKTKIPIPQNNLDLSDHFHREGWETDITTIKEISHQIFDYLSKFETINTNRLHMAIAGSLLGKKINFYPNFYYKNQAVFDYSIKNKFPKTTFINKVE